jgi:succinyl-CoA synthetase beta subunit
MKLPEYKASELFARYGIPCPRGRFFPSLSEIEASLAEIRFPCVIKAQVQAGGRGKAGGIRFAVDRDELLSAGKEVLAMKIKDLPVVGVLVAEKLSIAREWYVSIAIDRKARRPVLIFSTQGGVDINESAARHPESVVTTYLDPGAPIPDPAIRYIVDRCAIAPELLKPLGDVCRSLSRLFGEYDCLLAEINPLAVTSDGNLVAADGKLEIDDNALFRHDDMSAFRDGICGNQLVLAARRNGFLYIPVQRGGKVGVISNGSGMIMSSIDLLSKAGCPTACALDLGGGATCDRVAEAVGIVARNPDVSVLFINIFGGITRCDEIAGGVRIAFGRGLDTRAVVRVEGTNREAGLKILKEISLRIEIAEGLVDGVRKISAAVEQTGA